MKIFYLISSLANPAGTERILIDKMNFLSEKGYEIYAITYEQGERPIPFPLSPKVNHMDLDVPFYQQYKYPIFQRLYIHWKLSKELKRKLTSIIQQIKPEIVIATTYLLTEIKIVTGLKDNSKKILESHMAKEWIGLNKTNNPFMRIVRNIHKSLLYNKIKKSDVLVVLTQQDAIAWKKVKNAIAIPNTTGNFPITLNNTPRKNQVISVGRLEKQKGYDMLIKAWEIVNTEHPDWNLAIYGKGSEKLKLETAIVDNSLESSVYIYEPTKQIFDKYMESSFYVMSSRWEGFALVLIEAMSCGLPCVSFDCPNGPSEIIKNGENGYLIENGNVNQLAEKICYMIEHTEERIRMSENARENVKHYLPENIMPMWEKLFNDLLIKK